MRVFYVLVVILLAITSKSILSRIVAIIRQKNQHWIVHFGLRAVCRRNNELFLVPWNKTFKYLNYFLLGFYSKV